MFFWGRSYMGGRQTWKDWEINGIGVQDMKLTKNQLKGYEQKWDADSWEKKHSECER